MNENRTFGIELETMCKHDRHWVAAQLSAVLAPLGHSCQTRPYEHNTDSLNTTVWLAKPDGSLDECHRDFTYQCELVSPVLKGLEGLKVVEAVCNWIVSSRAFHITKKCGFHVHHGVLATELKPLCYKWKALEPVIMACLPVSRRSNVYCRTWQQTVTPYVSRRLAAENPMEWFERHFNVGHGQRYHTLNLASFTMRGTAEFRCAAGTFEYGKVANWVLVTQAIVEATNVPQSEIIGFDDLFTYLNGTTAQETPQETAARNADPRSAVFGNHRRGTASALVDEMLLTGINLHEAVARLQTTFANYANAPKTAERKFKGHVTYLIQRGVNIQRTGTHYVYVGNAQATAQAQAVPQTVQETPYANALNWLRERHTQFANVTN